MALTQQDLEDALGSALDGVDIVARIGEPFEITDMDHYRFLEKASAGISLVFKQGAFWSPPRGTQLLLEAVHLYGQGRDGYDDYGGPLPFDVTFGMTMDEAADALGKDARRGLALGRAAGTWLDLRTAHAKWRFEFGVRGLELVTVGPLEFVS